MYSRVLITVSLICTTILQYLPRSLALSIQLKLEKLFQVEFYKNKWCLISYLSTFLCIHNYFNIEANYFKGECLESEKNTETLIITYMH